MHCLSRDRRQSNSSARSQDSLHLTEQNTDDVPPSPCSDSSVDEDEMNCRMKPFWPKYQATFKQRGFQLETFKDVKLFYNQMNHNAPSNCLTSQKNFHQDIQDDDSLCPDAGLVCLSACCHGSILTSPPADPSLITYFEAHEFSMPRESWLKPYMLVAMNMMLLVRCPSLP